MCLLQDHTQDEIKSRRDGSIS